MQSLYLWPDNAALSIAVILLVSMVFLWAAREPMLKVLRGLFTNLEASFRAVANWCVSTADHLKKRSGEALLAAAELELHGKLDRELNRIDMTFSQKVGQYSGMHRKLDDLLGTLEADYKKCGDSPPEVPGWSSAVETVAAIPTGVDSNVNKVLEGIQGSMLESEKKVLKTYRDDTAKRHKILNGMRPEWKTVRNLMTRMQQSVARTVETTGKIERYINEHAAIVKDRESALRAITYSAFKPFFISVLVLAVAMGGAFINFQLIALPMSELVPAGSRIGGLPVSMVSALVIVLMEGAVGIFLMDMLGITDLFPKLGAISHSRRRIILGLSLAGLFFLASVESSLAILREQIVEADATLKLALAGADGEIVGRPTSSSIPMIGQAVLGFVLPWILAMVAIPLEMMLDSGRHVLAQFGILLLNVLGYVMVILAHAARSLTSLLPSIYDVYVAIPLRIERSLRGSGDESEDERLDEAEVAQ